MRPSRFAIRVSRVLSSHSLLPVLIVHCNATYNFRHRHVWVGFHTLFVLAALSWAFFRIKMRCTSFPKSFTTLLLCLGLTLVSVLQPSHAFCAQSTVLGASIPAASTVSRSKTSRWNPCDRTSHSSNRVIFSTNEIAAVDSMTNSNVSKITIRARNILKSALVTYAIFTIATKARQITRRSPLLSTIVIILLARELLRAVPSWVKLKIKRKSAHEKLEGLPKDPDDLSDLNTLAVKLQGLFSVARTKLQSSGEQDFDILGPLLILLQLTRQFKERQCVQRTASFKAAGTPGLRKDIEGLDESFEWADWAYDDSTLGSLKENLEREGFSLLRHDKTQVPGHLGHYVAISKRRNLAVIGIKGTSSLEDMLTDCCGLAVTHNLEAPFIPGGNTSIRCHEGVLISSRRLADDLQDFIEELLLPSSYQILVVGHSLGAAAASLFSVILRSRIPSLARDAAGKKLKVIAFASPPVFDYTNAKACAPFITTIVNNSDVVTRASLANVIIALELLKETNKTLSKMGMSTSNRKYTSALIQKLAKGTKGNLLMEASKYEAMVSNACRKVTVDDPDNLYVPGRVIIMYDKWEEVKTTGETGNEKKKDNDRSAKGFVLVNDGAAGVLRTIEMDTGMLADHMPCAYRASLNSLLTSEPAEGVPQDLHLKNNVIRPRVTGGHIDPCVS